MIVLIDHYDSFSHNIVQYLRMSGAEVLILQNDQHDLDKVIDAKPAGIVLSPGPGAPTQARLSKMVIEQKSTIPILGICLGMQIIAHCYGAKVGHAPCGVMHGKTSLITHDGVGIFDGIPQHFRACRYHSLAVSRDFPACFHANAVADDGTVMALCHRQLPLYGVQFHPEAILTEHGLKIIQNFLKLCHITVLDH